MQLHPTQVCRLCALRPPPSGAQAIQDTHIASQTHGCNHKATGGNHTDVLATERTFVAQAGMQSADNRMRSKASHSDAETVLGMRQMPLHPLGAFTRHQVT